MSVKTKIVRPLFLVSDTRVAYIHHYKIELVAMSF
jgi:hypothetical protein